MRIKDPQQTFLADEELTLVATSEEATLIAPRFDDEDTVLARPVVPLGETRTDEASAAGLPASSYTRMPSAAPRRPRMLALVLVSVLAGGLLGGVALYLYQNHSRGNDAPADSARQPEPSLPASPHPSPAPTTEAVNAPPPAAPNAQVEDPAANTPVNTSEADVSNSDAKETDTGTAGDAERVPADATRNESDEGLRVGTPKRGKKGEHDAEIEQPRRPANKEGDGRQLSRNDAAPDGREASDRRGASDRREARRVDTIFYRPRRTTRRDSTRRETAGDADRLRRIFEGQP
ncbi:MAG: hypothetical protein QOH51_3445 [Acidobacteriota bacterium]|jgi:hypothetical protein|nr:hypothetical protein [Acidobacteriota bacterium]